MPRPWLIASVGAIAGLLVWAAILALFAPTRCGRTAGSEFSTVLGCDGVDVLALFLDPLMSSIAYSVAALVGGLVGWWLGLKDKS